MDDRDKGKRRLYSTEAHSSEEGDVEDSNEESLFLTIEEKYQKSTREDCALHDKVEPRSWIIDSRFSNNMSRNKDNFITLKKYDCGSIKFVGEEVALIYGIGSISIEGKHKTDGIYYVKGLRNSLLSVS